MNQLGLIGPNWLLTTSFVEKTLQHFVKILELLLVKINKRYSATPTLPHHITVCNATVSPASG